MRRMSYVALVLALMLTVVGCGQQPAAPTADSGVKGGTASGAKGDAKPAAGAPSQPAAAQPAQPAAAAKPSGPVSLKFASNKADGSWYIYGNAVSKIAQPYLPQGSSVEVLPYNGGIANPQLVHQGKADLGLAFSSTANWAYNGVISYKEKHDNVRGLFGALGDPYRITINVDGKLGIKQLSEIKDKKMKVHLVTAQKGSFGEDVARILLEVHGMSYDWIQQQGGKVTNIDQQVAFQMMSDGRADVFIHVSSVRQPNVVEMTERSNIGFIGLATDTIKTLQQKYGFMALEFPKGEYKTLTENLPTAGFYTTVIVSKNVPDDVAYNIVKAVAENPGELGSAHVSLKGFDPKLAAEPSVNGDIPMHPGALKFFKEKGWVK